jgi:uncharacterized RDD family membrane protein YckC
MPTLGYAVNANAGSFSPPPHPLDQQWYVAENGQTIGPMPGAQLKELISKGQVTPKTLVCVVGASEWTEAGSVPFLSAMFAERAPPLPPMAPAIPAPPTADVRISQQGQYGGYPQPANAGNVRYAGFWIRTGASLLDTLFLFLLMIVPAFLAIMISGDANTPLAGLMQFAIAIGYFIIPVSGPKQATWGKQVLGLKIIRVDGAQVGGGLAFGRYLSYIISGLPFGIGYLMVAWTDQKKALHDMICGTRVIHKV